MVNVAQTESETPPAHLVVTIAGQRQALAIDLVQEVVPMPWITEVPQCPKEVCGVLDVHGEVLAVLDLEVLLHGTRRELTAADYLVLLALGQARVAIRTDGIEGLVQGELTPPPAEGALPPFVSGHVSHDGEAVPVLDVRALMRPELRHELARILERQREERGGS